MASKFQARLVGTVAVVALGVIFLPDIFDGKKQPIDKPLVTIPLTPEVESSVVIDGLKSPLTEKTVLPTSPINYSAQLTPITEKKPSTNEPIHPLSRDELADQQPAHLTSELEDQALNTLTSNQNVKISNSNKTEVSQITALKTGSNSAGDKVSNKKNNEAWIIQLMALKNKENAVKLVEELKSKGYQAHGKQENGFTRVLIGPNLSKTALKKQVIELEKITGSRGRLLVFQPVTH